MNNTHPIGKNQIEQVGVCLMQLAELAKILQNLVINIIDDGKEDFDSDKCVIARSLAAQVGWLADVSAKTLGVLQSYGGANDWMLPPRFHDLQKISAVAHE